MNFNGITLKRSDYGTEVYNLQVIMKTLGYYNGEYTSYYDETLENSIKAYQADNGIETTGELDETTIRYLLAKVYEDQLADYNNEISEVLNYYGAQFIAKLLLFLEKR